MSNQADRPLAEPAGALIVDAQGKRIAEGSVLRSIEDGCQKILKTLQARGLVFVRVCGTQFRWFPQ